MVKPKFSPPENNQKYYIHNLMSGNVIDISSTSGTTISCFSKNGGQNQQWTMVEGSLDGSWHFYNSSYGLYLAPAPGDPVKDDYLGPWFDLIATTELHYWRIKEITNDLTKESGYSFVDYDDKMKCMYAQGSGIQNIILTEDRNSVYQVWGFEPI